MHWPQRECKQPWTCRGSACAGSSWSGHMLMGQAVDICTQGHLVMHVYLLASSWLHTWWGVAGFQTWVSVLPHRCMSYFRVMCVWYRALLRVVLEGMASSEMQESPPPKLVELDKKQKLCVFHNKRACFCLSCLMIIYADRNGNIVWLERCPVLLLVVVVVVAVFSPI